MEDNLHSDSLTKDTASLEKSAKPFLKPPRIQSFLYLLLSFFLLFPIISMFKPASLASLRANLAIKNPSIQLDNEEGALLFQTQEIKNGRSIYHNLNDYPYVVGTYTPGFLWLNSLFVNPKNPTFESGRMVVWGAALGIGFVLSLIVMGRERNLAAAIFCPMLFLATYEVYDWIAYYRVDFPAIFLSLLGFLIFLMKPKNLTVQIIAGFFMILGLYTKQTVLAAPLSALIYLLISNRKQFLRFISILLVFGLIPFIILLMKTNGEFYNNVVKYNMNTWNINELKIWGMHVWRVHKWFFIAGLVSLCIHPLIQKQRFSFTGKLGFFSNQNKELFDPIWIYALVSLINYFAIAKAGSAPNYLLEPIAAWALLACVTYARCLNLLRSSSQLKTNILPTCYSFLLIAIFLTHSLPFRNPQFTTAMFNPGKNPDSSDIQIYNYIQRLVNKETDSYTETPIFNIKAGRSIYYQPFIMSELARQKVWEQTKFVTDIENGHFPLVVSQMDLTGTEPTNLYTPEMLRAFRESYKTIDVISSNKQRFYILKPKTDIEKNKVDMKLVSMLLN